MIAEREIEERMKSLFAESLEVTAPPTPFPEIAEHRRTA